MPKFTPDAEANSAMNADSPFLAASLRWRACSLPTRIARSTAADDHVYEEDDVYPSDVNKHKLWPTKGNYISGKITEVRACAGGNYSHSPPPRCNGPLAH